MSNIPALMDDVMRQFSHEMLFHMYKQPYDHSKPFGPDNVGPYSWQIEVHNNEKTERLLMAANRVGKCVTYHTLISTPQGQVTAGELYEAGQPFDVLAWGGTGVVSARAYAPFRKPGLHECYRLFTRHGWIECADHHRVFIDGSWVFVSDLLEFGAIRRVSSWESCLLTHALNARRLLGKLQGFLGDCLPDFRSDGEQPRWLSNISQVFPPLPDGAQIHTAVSCNSGDLVDIYTNSRQPSFAHLSNQGDPHHGEGRCWRFSSRDGYTSGQRCPSKRQESQPPYAVASFVVRLVRAVFQPIQRILPSTGAAYQSPVMASNQIIAYSPIGRQEVYDFTVEGLHNYIAGGIVNHNTQSAAAEVACHATGLYPSWWEGRKFTSPTTIWCGSESWTASRDIVQESLLGVVGEEGTGWIPKEYIIDWKKRQAGVSDVVDTIRVKHKNGGTSTITLKTYEQQRKEWQGRACHFIWFDEEPSMEIYTEALTRVLDHRGCLLMTFTPLKGPSEVVRHFLNPEIGASVFIKNVGWDEAPHLDDQARAELEATYPSHERDTRSKGTPLLGSGAIFPVRDEDMSVPPFQIPDHFARINGIDFGIDHPHATAFCAWDRDEDTFYVYDCYKRAGETTVYHAAALKKHGAWIPTSWPHDGMQRDKGTGTALKDQFRDQGCYMLKEHAHYRDERQNSREAGLVEMYEWMRTGKFKVFTTLTDWFEEKRLYHREDGKVVDSYDDIMSATRYAFVMRRYAKTQPIGTTVARQPKKPIVGGRSWRT